MKIITSKTANPAASPKSIVTLGCARFTILTPQMVRMEFAEDGVFEDRATLGAFHRRLKTPAFKTTVRKNSIAIKTSHLVIDYRETGRGFTASNLQIQFKVNGKWSRWHYGKKDRANLGGTTRTLDGATGDTFWHWKVDDKGNWSPDKKIPIDLGHGFLSKSGWAVVDESNNLVLEPAVDAMTPWPMERNAGKRQDLYFLGHGLDFKQALADAAQVFGSQPLPPRYTLGYWYSRYWAYTDREIEAVIDQFDQMNLPIDVMVIDMDWHLQGWTGYTWDKDYFPDPGAHLSDLKKRDIKITLNLHPADGVGKHEEAFPAMCRDLNLDPKRTDRIPFDCTNPQFIGSYFKRLHHPEEKRGVDFWWMDWQQGSETKIKGLDPLPWLNHLHWVDQEQNRAKLRPLNFSRFGGPGSGRYPIGFSGDTHSNWESLEYQPYFTATASNILYGTWSHDIGGHQPGPITPELYTRWIQFGIYSPVLRTHTSKNREAERRVWHYPEPYRDIMMESLRERYRLIPYIYSEMRNATDTGVSLTRPMYYEHPEAKEAYTFKNQYYFGGEMIVAPITKAVDEKSESADIKVWLPHGNWFDISAGRLERGSKTITRSCLLAETPVFAKAGSIIPGQADTTRTNPGSYEHLTVHAYPGGDGSYTLYEDDGISNEYIDDACVRIRLSQRTVKNKRVITIGSAKGSYKGFKKRRPVTVCLHGSAPLEKSVVNGKVQSSVFDGDTAVVTIKLGTVDLTKATKIEAVTSSKAPRIFSQGWRGMMTRMIKICEYANLVSPPHPIHPEERLAIRMGQTGNRLTRWPEKANQEIREFNRLFKRLPRVLEEFQAEYKSRNDQGAADIVQQARNVLKSVHRF